MPNFKKLEIVPIPPNTTSSVKQDLIPFIRQVLQEEGKETLLINGDIRIVVEKTFPVEGAIIVGLTLVSGMALETYKALILPKLKARFDVKEQLSDEEE